MKSYLITDPNIYTNNENTFKRNLENTLKNNNIDYICFRDKTSNNYEKLAKIFIDTSKKYNIKNIYINQHIDLAYKMNAKGVHLTSTQFNKIVYAKSLKLKTIISCHNEDEIINAMNNNVDYITYSAIFNTPNKGKEKGIEHLIKIVNKYNKIKIFALGGIITNQHILEIKNTNAYGFASIRYFTK